MARAMSFIHQIITKRYWFRTLSRSLKLVICYLERDHTALSSSVPYCIFHISTSNFYCEDRARPHCTCRPCHIPISNFQSTQTCPNFKFCLMQPTPLVNGRSFFFLLHDTVFALIIDKNVLKIQWIYQAIGIGRVKRRGLELSFSCRPCHIPISDFQFCKIWNVPTTHKLEQPGCLHNRN